MSFRLNVIDRDGNEILIDIEEGTTIRDAIDDKLEPDNFGLCGGNCNCGTCHVYIKPSDFEKLQAMKDDEKMRIESSALDPNQYSRLGCQIEFKKEYDDITITIAPD